MVPVAAIAGSVAGAALFAVLEWVGMKIRGDYGEYGWMYRYILPVADAAVFGGLFTYISYAVAPRGKLIAGTVMATLLAVVCVGDIIFAWVVPENGAGDASLLSIEAVAAAVAGVVTLASAHSDRRMAA